jgi:hypothetical protein
MAKRARTGVTAKDVRSGGPQPQSMIMESEKEIWQLQPTDLYADAKIAAEEQFLDDLSAANRCKTFLVGVGAGVPNDVLKGLGALTSAFSGDLAIYEARFRPATHPPNERGIHAPRSWFFKFLRFVGIA